MDPFITSFLLFGFAGLIVIFMFAMIIWRPAKSSPIIIEGIILAAILCCIGFDIREKENNRITCTFKGGVYVDQKCLRGNEEIPLK